MILIVSVHLFDSIGLIVRRYDSGDGGRESAQQMHVRRGMFASGFGKQSHKKKDDEFDVTKVVRGPRHAGVQARPSGGK